MQNLKAKLKKQGGFTLIEMLIVVAIIAILIAIAIPLVNKALESAREATDAANERAAIGLAMVEVLTDGKLGGVAPTSTNKAVCAEYIINNNKGSLGTGAAAADAASATVTTTGTAYGKGTTLEGSFKSKDNNVGKVIVVIYDSSATTEDAMFTTKWVEGKTS